MPVAGKTAALPKPLAAVETELFTNLPVDFFALLPIPYILPAFINGLPYSLTSFNLFNRIFA